MKLRRILIVAALLLFNTVFFALPRGGYQQIVIHHSAGQHGDFRTIRRSHLARGWFEIGYHFVLSNGSTEVEAGHLEPTWRYRLGIWSVATRSWRHNHSALHLCVVGNFEERVVPTSLQLSLGHAVRALQQAHHIADQQILLHRDCSPTACPGQFITAARVVDWAKQSTSSPAATQNQHRAAINSWRLSSWVYLLLWVICHGLLIWAWRRPVAGHGPGDLPMVVPAE